MCRTSFINKTRSMNEIINAYKKRTVRKGLYFSHIMFNQVVKWASLRENEKERKCGSFCLRQCLWILLICTSVYICNNHIQNERKKKCWHSSNNSSLKMRYYYEFLATVFFLSSSFRNFTLSHENENYENLTN